MSAMCNCIVLLSDNHTITQSRASTIKMAKAKLKEKSNYNKGFTLVETLVTMLVFTLVIEAAVAILVSAIRLQKYNLAYFKIVDQTSYALEYMGRQVRMAQRDSSGGCIASNSRFEIKQIPAPADLGITGLMFIDSKGVCKGFFLNLSTNRINEYDFSKGQKILEITPDDIEISSLNFELLGQSGMDLIQPRVAISMKVRGKNPGVQPTANIQTTISARNLDF